MKPVTDFIYQTEGNQKKILLFLHHLLSDELFLDAKIRYRIPFYYGKSWICYLNPRPGDKIELVFLRGNELSNEQGLLDAKGRKQVAGVEFTSVKEIPEAVLREVIQEALLLDEVKPYGSKRKKKQ